MWHQDDDYGELVEAGFAILLTALLLVAVFLFILPKTEHTDADPQADRPSATSPLVSSNAHHLQP